MKQVLFFVITLIFTQSCDINDEELTMSRMPYLGDEIKVNGCYIYSLGDKYGSIYTFFYQNGVALNISDKSNIENISQFNHLSSQYDDKTNWCIFEVTQGYVTMQGWKPSASELYYQNVLNTSTYQILNDTTLSKVYPNGFIGFYYFKKFSPKPDSTNVFIK